MSAVAACALGDRRRSSCCWTFDERSVAAGGMSCLHDGLTISSDGRPADNALLAEDFMQCCAAAVCVSRGLCAPLAAVRARVQSAAAETAAAVQPAWVGYGYDV